MKKPKFKIVSIPTNNLVVASEIRFYKTAEYDDDGVYYADMRVKGDTIYRTLNTDDLRKMLQKFNKSKVKENKHKIRRSGIIPKGLVYVNMIDYNEFIWISPRQVRNIIIMKNGINKSHSINVPAVIFHVKRKDVAVYLTSKDNGMDSIIYPAPFMNTSDSGGVCIGNQDIKNADQLGTLEEFMEHWETIFFNSPFTHNSKGKWMFTKSFKPKTYIDAWKFITTSKTIKLSWIKKTNNTIKDLIR